MGEPRIIDVELDERTIIRRSDEIEQEKRVAIFDLLEGNQFQPLGHEGPFRIRLAIEDNRLAIALRDEAGAPLETIRLSLGRFKRPVRDYFAICESYFKAVRSNTPKGLEAIDMARRAVHNEAAELLQECLGDRVEMDFDTARRLFTLICVLHIK
ncbi:MAG TPA: UPF0262 family protein [Allosphingosinicella sp.]|jgi:uncharacterized protein (UPF0262 family)